MEGKKPFTIADEKEISKIFERANLPKKAEAKFNHNVKSDEDDLLVSRITESIHIHERKGLQRFVPERSAIKDESPREKKPRKRRA